MAIDVTDVLERADAVLAELRALDLDAVDDDTLSDAALQMQRLRGGLEVAEARVLARWDAQGAWRPSGAKSAAAWLAWQQHLPIGITRQRMRHARALRNLPAVEEAWGAGDIDRSHVTTLLGARNPRTAEVFDRDHKELVDIARESWFSHFKITLDPVSGTIVNETLRIIERELFEADWAEAKERLGRDPLITDLARTPAQRRADALVEMAARARTAPPGGRRPAPLFTVVVGLDTLKGPILELLNRTILTPGQAASWLTEADVERIVFDPPSRVVDVGAQRRFFRGALRRALEVRDRACFHPTCDEVPDRPQADHIHEASKGGPTTQHNGRWGCAFHNRWRTTHPDPDRDPDPTEPCG